ncbi:MAG: hypothetical protein D6689_11095, partial [Deltaproteobacteria bacterium]
MMATTMKDETTRAARARGCAAARGVMAMVTAAVLATAGCGGADDRDAGPYGKPDGGEIPRLEVQRG